jgi:hypothetical protein
MNLLDHPEYDLLPSRTQKKLLSPVSKDKLTWDSFFMLHRAGLLDKQSHVILMLIRALRLSVVFWISWQDFVQCRRACLRVS